MLLESDGSAADVVTTTSEQKSDLKFSDALSQFLAPSAPSMSTSCPNKVNIRIVLEKFFSTEPYPDCEANLNIIDYWLAQKHTDYEELSKLTDIVYGVPATQNSVERLFSHLKYIFNDQRASLNTETLNNVILLRLNKM